MTHDTSHVTPRPAMCHDAARRLKSTLPLQSWKQEVAQRRAISGIVPSAVFRADTVAVPRTVLDWTRRHGAHAVDTRTSQSHDTVSFTPHVRRYIALPHLTQLYTIDNCHNGMI